MSQYHRLTDIADASDRPLVRVAIPASVEYLLQLDDAETWRTAYPAAEYIETKRGQGVYDMPAETLAEIVRDVRYFAWHGTEGSPSRRRTALQWADKMGVR